MCVTRRDRIPACRRLDSGRDLLAAILSPQSGGAAAIPDDGYELKVEIFDGSGNPVSLEKFSNKGMSGARVLPVKTGTYLVKITLGEQNEKRSSARELDWALVYGYR